MPTLIRADGTTEFLIMDGPLTTDQVEVLIGGECVHMALGDAHILFDELTCNPCNDLATSIVFQHLGSCRVHTIYGDAVLFTPNEWDQYIRNGGDESCIEA